MMTEGPEGFNWMKSLESLWLEALKVELVAVLDEKGAG